MDEPWSAVADIKEDCSLPILILDNNSLASWIDSVSFGDLDLEV
jgi:hypothetical protein